jgi:dihydroorotate dehydrogenase electron transfer subunit
MPDPHGHIIEIRVEEDGFQRAMVACPAEFVPAPGRYLLAHLPADPDAPLAIPLLATGYAQNGRGFTAAPPFPAAWQPGAKLFLRGPLGRGFSPSVVVRRLALAALGGHAARLMPLALSALDSGGEVALFTDAPLPRLPASLEAAPLSALPDALRWADRLALDGPLAALEALPPDLRRALPRDAEMLIEVPMPCGGLAECGICAVPAARVRWHLACEDGPVFPLVELDLDRMA